MITMLNRKELCTVCKLEDQARIRNILADNGIDYTLNVVNRMSPSPLDAGTRTRTGTLGMDPDNMNEYRFYVKKDDYEKATFLLRK